MKPKEKAEELIKKFIKHSHECYKSDAIQCALICVDKIIKDRQRLSDALFHNDTYWQEVKREINNFKNN